MTTSTTCSTRSEPSPKNVFCYLLPWLLAAVCGFVLMSLMMTVIALVVSGVESTLLDTRSRTEHLLRLAIGASLALIAEVSVRVVRRSYIAGMATAWGVSVLLCWGVNVFLSQKPGGVSLIWVHYVGQAIFAAVFFLFYAAMTRWLLRRV